MKTARYTRLIAILSALGAAAASMAHGFQAAKPVSDSANNTYVLLVTPYKADGQEATLANDTITSCTAKWDSRPHLRKGRLTTIKVWYPASLTLTFTQTPVNYGANPVGGIGAQDAVSLAYTTATSQFVADGDVCNVTCTLLDSNKNQVLAFQDYVQVNFDLLRDWSISYSGGVLFSALKDASVQNVGGTITQGPSKGGAPKAAALVHLAWQKNNDFLWGPCFGGVTAGSNVGVFAGIGIIYGGANRLAVSVGCEYSPVNVLSGYTIGETGVASTATLTESVYRWSRPEICITYNFSTAAPSSTGGGSTKKGG